MTQSIDTTATARVAATIRAELARRRIPQTIVAERLGMSQPSLSRRLTGDTPFDVNELAIVAEILGIPLATLIGDAS